MTGRTVGPPPPTSPRPAAEAGAVRREGKGGLREEDAAMRLDRGGRAPGPDANVRLDRMGGLRGLDGPLLDRRGFLRMAGGLSVAAGAAALPGCTRGGRGAAASRPIRFGAVSSQSGSLAGFGESDAFVFQQVRQELKDGLEIGGDRHPVEIRVRDNASDPARAGEVARDLIDGGIDLMVVAGAPETVNPVSDACERAGVPCLSSSAPWQPWYFGRQKDPAHPQPFQWTYHFFWGLEDIIRVFGGLWQQIDNDQTIAGLFALNADGDAWADPARGLPGAFKPRGYRFAPVPRFPDLNDNFDAQIDACTDGRADILTGNPQPPDFATFWNQASRRRYRPVVASVGKALLFPAFVEVLTPNASGLATEVWWHPSWPFRSSLTGQTCAQLAADYTRQTYRQWSQPLGPMHAAFEVAVAALKRAGVGDRRAIVDAIRSTDMQTVVGHLAWGRDRGLPPTVARSPLVGGQWRQGRDFPFDLVLVSNADYPQIPVASRLQPLGTV
jgi:branched-chain amino acid transport system substrate-binding protein